MTRRLVWMLFALAAIAAVSPAHAAEFVVGSCMPQLPQFPTISAAVSGVPVGSTILVCPGTYHEQVVISQPLTLKGVAFNNMDRPTILPPPNGLAINVTSITGEPFAAQLLALNTGPTGNIVVADLTVDGTAAEVPGCSTSAALAGIFYGSNTSGTISDVTVRNQTLPSCGYGIWLENGAGPNQSITVTNSSVHDVSFRGITAASNQTPSTLAATIKGNFVNGNNNQFVAIDVSRISGTIMGNVITGGIEGIANAGGPVTISGNSVADMPIGVGIGVGDGSTVSNNRISNVFEAFLFGGSGVSPGPTVMQNTTKNTTYVIEYNCIPNVTVKSNSFNDSQDAYLQLPSTSSGLGVNSLYNIDTITASTCP